MEGLTRLVSESLARYGLDRPVDYRRLQWSRWFRCETLHSLLHVPSKPGVFALAEEVAAFCGASDPRSRNPERSEGYRSQTSIPADQDDREGSDSDKRASTGANDSYQGTAFSRAADALHQSAASAADAQRRMLSVLQFCEDDDMAFVLDRMISRRSAQPSSGHCFVRFVVIEDAIQRRSICNALNQWLVSTAETVTGIGAHFATSLEFTIGQAGVGNTAVGNRSVGRTLLSATAYATKQPAHSQAAEVKSLFRQDSSVAQASPLDSGFASNIHCPHPLPSGF